MGQTNINPGYLVFSYAVMWRTSHACTCFHQTVELREQSHEHVYSSGVQPPTLWGLRIQGNMCVQDLTCLVFYAGGHTGLLWITFFTPTARHAADDSFSPADSWRSSIRLHKPGAHKQREKTKCVPFDLHWWFVSVPLWSATHEKLWCLPASQRNICDSSCCILVVPIVAFMQHCQWRQEKSAVFRTKIRSRLRAAYKFLNQ